MTIPTIASYAMPAALPQTRRTNWQLQAPRCALLIHDMQEYFLDFYQRDVEPVPTLLAHIQQLRAACDAAGIPVFYSAQPAVQSVEQRGLLQDWWGPGLTAKPQRCAIVKELAPRQQDIVMGKWRYSAFYRSSLAQDLKAQGRDQLMICGVYANIGCMTTALDAFMQDIQTFMIGDALADFSAEQHAQALEFVSQRCGIVLSTKQSLQALGTDLAPSLPRSLVALQAEVANLLQIEVTELALEDDLLYAGLDSIRIMHLLQGWQALGSRLSFVQLASQPRLNHWWQLLQEEQQTQQLEQREQRNAA